MLRANSHHILTVHFCIKFSQEASLEATNAFKVVNDLLTFSCFIICLKNNNKQKSVTELFLVVTTNGGLTTLFMGWCRSTTTDAIGGAKLLPRRLLVMFWLVLLDGMTFICFGLLVCQWNWLFPNFYYNKSFKYQIRHADSQKNWAYKILELNKNRLVI